MRLRYTTGNSGVKLTRHVLLINYTPFKYLLNVSLVCLRLRRGDLFVLGIAYKSSYLLTLLITVRREQG